MRNRPQLCPVCSGELELERPSQLRLDYIGPTRVLDMRALLGDIPVLACFGCGWWGTRHGRIRLRLRDLEG